MNNEIIETDEMIDSVPRLVHGGSLAVVDMAEPPPPFRFNVLERDHAFRGRL